VRKRRRLAQPGPFSAGDRWAALILCALALSLWGLAVGSGPTAWAAPGQSPAGQTVPTRPSTAAPPQPSSAPEAGRQEPLPSPTLIPATPSPALTTSATSAGSTAVPQSRVTATQEVPVAPPATPAAALFRPEPAVVPPTPEPSFFRALPGPRVCAPAITPETRMDLPAIYEEHRPSSLLWMLPLGMGMMLVGIGLALIFRSGR
jgi:hypothetical protein